jgi:hypothetical protein
MDQKGRFIFFRQRLITGIDLRARENLPILRKRLWEACGRLGLFSRARYSLLEYFKNVLRSFL